MATFRNNGVKSNTREDVGFGLQSRTGRLINKDGRFNVDHEDGRFFHIYDLYIKLIRMTWTKFSVMIVAFYSTLNLLFAMAYWVIGIDQLTGINTSTPFTAFMDAFFFSAQTLTTVGYGRIAPTGIMASSVAALESLTGALSFALATGLLYGRFSRPVANLVYSKHMLVAPHNGGRALMFRIANRSHNQLIEGEMVVTAAYQEPGQNGPCYITDHSSSS